MILVEIVYHEKNEKYSEYAVYFTAEHHIVYLYNINRPYGQRGSKMRQFNPDTDCMLVVDNHHGRFMPYRFCMNYEDSLMAAGFKDQFFEIIWAVELELESEDWQNHDDAWCSIMDNYVHKENDRKWVLMYGPCGDLFLVATDVELPDWE